MRVHSSRRKGRVLLLRGAAAASAVLGAAFLPLTSGAEARPATASPAAPPVTTSVSDVRPLQLASGAPSMVTYQVTHDVQGHVDPDTALPGAQVARSDYQDAFQGLWGADFGDLAAWLAPANMVELGPASTFVQSSYFTDSVLPAKDVFGSPQAVPLESGDHVELSVADVPLNAPLPWDRERGAVDGSLGWDFGMVARRITATYGGTTGRIDAVFFRADIVARGGDVDARGQAVSLPPLTFDLPQTYQDTPMHIVSVFAPYTAYVDGFRLQVSADTGKAVLTATARGYLFEAREVTLPGGAQLQEWHIPLVGAILLDPDATSTGGEPQAAIDMLGGGVAEVERAGIRQQLDIPPGAALRAGPVTGVKVEGGAPGATPEPDPSGGQAVQELLPTTPRVEISTLAQNGETTELMRELGLVAPIDASLAQPIFLPIGNRNYALTLDPDYRGEGVLALESVRRSLTGSLYAKASAIPFAVVGAAPVKLSRDRLIDLRVVPLRRDIGLTLTGRGALVGGGLSRLRKQSGQIYLFNGVIVDAVYDLGAGGLAFLRYEVKTDNPAEPGLVVSRAVAVSMSGEPPSASFVQYVELPEVGPVTYDGQTIATEFSAPLDVLGDHPRLQAGDHQLEGTISAAEDGVVTVVRAPGALTPTPVADQTVSISGEPLAVYYSAPAGAADNFSVLLTELLSDVTWAATPAPIGELCGQAQAEDLPVPDAAPELDVLRGWFDSDRANLYATIELRQLPSAAPPGTKLFFTLHWRREHVGRYARATLDEAGTWTFDEGGYNNAFFHLEDVTGEVRAGSPGYVRIVIPRSLLGYRDGELLRDTGAHSWSQAVVTAEVDGAPPGTDDTYGSGRDYAVGTGCSPTAAKVASFAARRTGHGVIVTWKTAAETDVLGFNVWRFAPGRKGVKVNRTLVAAKSAERTVGATYRLLDRRARPGVAYTYRLQAVSTVGTRAWSARTNVRVSR